MPPIRRYLRISKYSVLECRIFLENPADGPRWLLHPQDPALPRVFEAIRHLILPKLREENERARGKGKKKKSVKDVVTHDEFEVSLFLTEIGARHSLLTKSKTFQDKERISSNTTKMTGDGADPVLIHDEDEDNDDADEIDLDMIASADSSDDPQRGGDSRGDRFRKVGTVGSTDSNAQQDDKKKLGFKTSYEGFSIWGWVLCLLVTRKGGHGKPTGTATAAQALMEEWIASTQALQEDDE